MRFHHNNCFEPGGDIIRSWTSEKLERVIVGYRKMIRSALVCGEADRAAVLISGLIGLIMVREIFETDAAGLPRLKVLAPPPAET